MRLARGSRKSIAVADLDAAERILRETLGERVGVRVPLAPLTTFRLGGPAALFVQAEDDAALSAVGRTRRETGAPVVVIGKGSNVLISDAGFPGIVVRLARGYRWAGRDGDVITAGGAMPLPALAGVALRHGLAGLEFGVAIPATLGGAVKMNAGAHGRSMSDVIDRVDVFSFASGRRSSLDRPDAGFAYRRSAVPPDAVVVGAAARLHPADVLEIRTRMDEARNWRRRTQPLAEPNCGSVFKNPEGDQAARLIDAAGGKGLRVGGAVVSAKHANFIVAEPGATASDVWELIGRVRDLVGTRAGVDLETEVQLLGEMADANG
jgi:UDP-N-acetylmuramate dehydrogenase